MKKEIIFLMLVFILFTVSACQEQIGTRLSADRGSSSGGGYARQGYAPQTNQEQLAVDCAKNPSLNNCNQLPPALKAAVEDYLAQEYNDPSKCTTTLCKQKTSFFNCIKQGESSQKCLNSAITDAFPENPNFTKGDKFYISYGYTPRNEKELFAFQLSGSKIRETCRLKLAVTQQDFSVLETDVPYKKGTILSNNKGSSIYSYSSPAKNSIDYCEGKCPDIHKPLPLELKKNCGSSKCNILSNQELTMKGDLLCGQDGRWYLCDQDGIKKFNNEKYVCDSISETWQKLD